MVVVAQCAQQHTLAGVEFLAVGLNLDAVKTAAENGLDNTPTVGVFVALAAQLIGGRCHHRVKTKVADVDGVVVTANLHYVYLGGVPFTKLSTLRKSLPG